MDLRFEINKAMLELNRLNTLRNFTRQPGDKNVLPLSWQVERYSQLNIDKPVEHLLLAITTYGALASGAGNAEQYYNNDPAWLYTFNRVGEKLFFELPNLLSGSQRSRFDSESHNSFMLGWSGKSLPHE